MTKFVDPHRIYWEEDQWSRSVLMQNENFSAIDWIRKYNFSIFGGVGVCGMSFSPPFFSVFSFFLLSVFMIFSRFPLLTGLGV